MTNPDVRRHRGSRLAAVILLANALWLADGALRGAPAAVPLAVMAALSLLAAVVAWNADRWLSRRREIGSSSAASRQAGMAAVQIGALLLALLLALVLLIAYFGGRMWR